MTDSDSDIDLIALENRLLVAWKDVFGISNLKISQSDFFELGGDSLKFMSLQSRVSDLIGFELSPGQLFETPTISLLAKFISSSDSNRESLHFNHMRNMSRQNRKSPIYICHGMYGDTFEWRFIADALSSNRYVYGLQDPTYWTTSIKNSYSTMELLGHYHAKEIRKHSDDNLCLAGYSVGAWVAYSTAIELEKLGSRNIKLYLFEPSNLPCVQSYALSMSQLLKMGFKSQGKSDGTINVTNRAKPPNLDIKTFQLKYPKADQTYLKSLYYVPSPSNALINIAFRSEVIKNPWNYYLCSISNKLPRLQRINGMSAHLDFKLKDHATTIAQSIEYAFEC